MIVLHNWGCKCPQKISSFIFIDKKRCGSNFALPPIYIVWTSNVWYPIEGFWLQDNYTIYWAAKRRTIQSLFTRVSGRTSSWIHFAWTAQLTTTFSYNLENVFVLCCWLLAGNAQGHFFLPIYLLLIVYLFLLLELFGNFTRRAFSGPSPLAIVYCQRLHLRT